MPSSLLQFDADGFFCCMWSTYMCSHSMLFEECDVTSTLQYLYVLSCRSVPDFAVLQTRESARYLLIPICASRSKDIPITWAVPSTIRAARNSFQGVATSVSVDACP